MTLAGLFMSDAWALAQTEEILFSGSRARHAPGLNWIEQ
ncbi:hypothetical protein CPter91_3828 [Collimonas pratensis]|uniref:Uncharacterized protein n=1 Tax=Collimonas pratensis TaxID=279113 RepID=A0A127Q7V2_9BURK|nr:hypothetical protein CPter91_3828 [Collimonas pratensis]